MAYNPSGWIMPHHATVRPIEPSLFAGPMICPQPICAPSLFLGGEHSVRNLQGHHMLNDKTMVLLPPPQGLVREHFPALPVLPPPPKEQVGQNEFITYYF